MINWIIEAMLNNIVHDLAKEYEEEENHDK